MAIGIVNHKTATQTSGTSLTTAAFDSAGASLFVVGGIWVNQSDSTVGTRIQDIAGNTYTVIDTGALVPRALLFYCENPTTNAAHTFTLNASTSNIHSIFVLAVSGTALSSSLDQHNRNADSSSPFTSPSITTTQADEILVSLLSGDSGSNPATTAESTGFTIDDSQLNGSSIWVGSFAHKIVSSTGTYNASWTQSGSSNTDVFIASFIGASGGGGVTTAWLTA